MQHAWRVGPGTWRHASTVWAPHLDLSLPSVCVTLFQCNLSPCETTAGTTAPKTFEFLHSIWTSVYGSSVTCRPVFSIFSTLYAFSKHLSFGNHASAPPWTHARIIVQLALYRSLWKTFTNSLEINILSFKDFLCPYWTNMLNNETIKKQYKTFCFYESYIYA